MEGIKNMRVYIPIDVIGRPLAVFSKNCDAVIEYPHAVQLLEFIVDHELEQYKSTKKSTK